MRRNFKTVQDMSELPDPSSLPMTMTSDTETTSFRGEVNALSPEKGARACGYGFGTLEGDAWYLPVRHSGPDVGLTHHNLPLDKVKEYMCELERGRTWIGHNIKFDQRVKYQDGITGCKGVEDTQILARLCYHDHPNYSLGWLSSYYKKRYPALAETDPSKTSQSLREYLKNTFDNKEQWDYGAVPIDTMGQYNCDDVYAASALREFLLNEMLPDRSHSLWANECELSGLIVKEEIRGIPVDVEELWAIQRQLIHRQVELMDEIESTAGFFFDPDKKASLNWALIDELGLSPSAYTKKTHQPKWDKLAFKALDHPIGEVLYEWSECKSHVSNICQAWLNRTDEAGRLHPSFNLSGARTGRFSSSDPNFQNVPRWAETLIHPPEGYMIVGFDYSQVEYRFFAHYADDENIIRAYNEDPETDYHQMFAGVLQLPRQFAKQLNFSFLFGMGKEKLLRTLATMLTAAAARHGDDPEKALYAMKSLAFGSGTEIAERSKRMSQDQQMMAIAEAIYAEYHRKFPTIRRFSRQVANRLKRRGYVYNFFGRTYFYDQPVAHKAVNAICQGGAADYVKNRLVPFLRDLCPKYGAEFMTTVHDSMFAFVPLEEVVPFYLEAQTLLQSGPKMKVPILVEGKLGASSWGHVVELKKNANEEDVLIGIERAKENIHSRGYYGDQKALRTGGRVNVA